MLDYANRFVGFVRANWFKTPGLLLDIGCGDGSHSNAFEEAGFKTVRIDKEPTTKIIGCDLNKEKLNSIVLYNGADYIYARSVIEYLKDTVSFMQQCYKAIKPGGKIFILTPNWVTQHHMFYDNYTRCSPFTVRSLKLLAEDTGFTTIHSGIWDETKYIWRFTEKAFHEDKNGKYIIYVGEKKC
jgi:2-polyprenyl-3-methyl-5-hydroxy-6-metoxy-1,4-benzoquinol methylase